MLLAEQKIEQMQESLQNLTEERDELRGKMDELSERLFKNAVPELATSHKRIEELTRETKLQRKTLASTALQLASMSEDYGQVQDELTLTQEELANARQELEQVSERMEGMSRETALQKKAIVTHVQNIVSLEAQKDELQKELEKLKQAAHTAERDLQIMRERQQPLIMFDSLF